MSIQYQLNWERIFGSKEPRGICYMLPSETAAVIVQHEPDFRITALLPPAERRLEINYRGVRALRNHQTPFLLSSHLVYIRSNCDPYQIFPKVNQEMIDSLKHFPWCYCRNCNIKAYHDARIVDTFYLFGANPITENEILAQPYRLNNVYPEGKCCFRKGHSDHAQPKNLKQAHARFWMDYFSDEFMPKKLSHECYSKHHDFQLHQWPSTVPVICDCVCCQNTCSCSCICNLADLFADSLANYKPTEPWENYTNLICGDQFVSHPKSSEAVFISNDPSLLSIIPIKYHKKSKTFPEHFLIGFASFQESVWDINLIGLQFTLDKKQVAIQQ